MTPNERRILVVDDDADVVAGLGALLEHAGWSVETAATGREAFRKFEEFSPDLVLLDVMLPDMPGLEVLDQIKGESESTAVVMMSGMGTIDMAVQAMKMGAETFVSKPCDFDSLEVVLEQSARMIETRRELAALRRSSVPRQSGFTGVSSEARRIEQLIGQVASATSPVLLTGESGTGKGVVARMIHLRSERSRAPFVDLNCAGFSRELLESELFGHERGAFTDARTAKPGLFEIAGNGVVFLDEIGEMELAMQGRLLKAIEEKRFRRIGGLREIKADFRLIAATNRDLEADVAAGRFRQDLFYRLNVVAIRIPPLRERLDDVPILVDHLLRELGSELGARGAASLSERAMARLQNYPWPGNVRELRNVLERALLVRRGEEIRVEDLLLGTGAAVPSAGLSEPENEWDIRPLDQIQSDYVRKAVDATGGNIRSAARRLGISPSTVYARLKR
ncbi:MAG TPA: sigma-54 dependent transcriptional regulator [Thermoanaerobaculia bacterium]|nr:sigma-54 dependent transcriptional regulator [Thermoanaerobaculia bacterium]